MDETEEQQKQISFKILVDKEQNRVVFAEADKDFLDVLLSFLTLPMGTIVRLVREQSEPSTVGSMTTLYEGVENLDVQFFQSENHKTMLLRPSNSAEPQCRKLKLNVDDTEYTKYYVCNCTDYSKSYMYASPNMVCGHGSLAVREMYLIEDDTASRVDKKGGVFVKGTASFMISDDLKVLPLSSSTGFELLMKLGVKDASLLEERNVKVGLAEVLSLLKLSMLSDRPLTELFLLNPEEYSKALMLYQEFSQIPQIDRNPAGSCKMTLKFVLRKSNNNLLYAEAQEDFVDFLLSLLTIPLGAVVKLLDGTDLLGCYSNLYKSVEGLSVERYIKSHLVKSKILEPKLGPQFVYKNQPLGINDSFNPLVASCLFQMSDSSCMNSSASRAAININSHPSYFKQTEISGFIEGPALFMVTDDLVVTPLSPMSSIFILDQLKVPISDIEERVVSFGKEEALRLLEASMTTKSALTRAFSLNMRWKEQESEQIEVEAAQAVEAAQVVEAARAVEAAQEGSLDPPHVLVDSVPRTIALQYGNSMEIEPRRGQRKSRRSSKYKDCVTDLKLNVQVSEQIEQVEAAQRSRDSPDVLNNQSVPKIRAVAVPRGNSIERRRCIRKDGKSWRCSNECVPNQNYCEKHLNRGKKLKEQVENPNQVTSPSNMVDSSPNISSSTPSQVVTSETNSSRTSQRKRRISKAGFLVEECPN